jgi:dihydroxyacetone kinase-like predicted kinase
VGPRRLGARSVGDEATLKVHVHTDEPEAAVALFEGSGEVTNLDVADMREQIAERRARLQSGRTGALAVAAGEGLERLFAELGAHVVPAARRSTPRPTSCWPGSTRCLPRRSSSFPAPPTW